MLINWPNPIFSTFDLLQITSNFFEAIDSLVLPCFIQRSFEFERRDLTDGHKRRWENLMKNRREREVWLFIVTQLNSSLCTTDHKQSCPYFGSIMI